MRIILNKRYGRGTRPIPRMILATVIGLTAIGTGCSQSTASSDGSGRVRVVAAENFWGSIARQIGGDDANVTSIIGNPDADPHDYEPTARDARAIASAQLVIENGIGYDPWAAQLLRVDGGTDRTVLDVGKVVGVDEGGNPHQWYSSASVAKVIDRIAADLDKIDPGHTSTFEHNARVFKSDGLAEYAALVDTIKREYGGTPIGASESIVTLLAEDLGLRVITPEGFVDAIAEGNEPTAQDKATTDAEIRNRQIKVFVYNSQNTTPDVQRLVDQARAEHIPVTTVTETLTPEHATFQDWQVRQLRALRSALDEAYGR